MNDRALLSIFVALVILFLVPVWSVHYIPTADGPAHLYNSWLIKELVSGDVGLLAQVYKVDWRPHPNWLGHAVMALLMVAVPPLIAEKLLFSLIIILFLGGTWMLCGAVDRGSRVYAFIAFQLAYHQLLQTGFYNFSLGVGLYMILLAVWWKRRNAPGAKTIALVAPLLILCYFAHPISAVLGVGSLGLLWLLTIQERPLRTHALHLAAIVPVVPLLFWFVRQRGGDAVATDWSPARLFQYVFETEVLVTFTVRQLTFGKWMLIVYALLAVATIARDFRRREANAFGLLTLVLIGLLAWSPAQFAGGQLVRERLVLFIYLLPLAWFSPRLPKWVQNGVVAVFVAAAVARAAFTVERYRHYAAEVEEYVSSYRAVRPGTTVLPLLATRDTPDAFTGVVGHASGYAAIDKRLVDLDNYEPGTGYFPTAFRSDYAPPDMVAIEARPMELDIRPYVSRAQYVFTWKMPDSAPVVTGLNQHYRLISSTGSGRVYERKTPSQFGAGEDLETVLLPIAGTPREAAPAAGRSWRVEQTVTNTSAKPVRVGLSSCPELPACELDIDPGDLLRLSASRSDPPYLMLTARAADAALLKFTTNVERADGTAVHSSAVIPEVRERAFREGSVLVRGVTFHANSRLNLRLWTRGISGSNAVTIRVRATDGRQIATTTQSTDAAGFFTHGDFESVLPDVPHDVPLEIECRIPRGAIWAFVTGTDNATERVTVWLPRER